MQTFITLFVDCPLLCILVDFLEERMMKIADRVKGMREQAGLSQVNLAQIIGVDVNTVWRWENGRSSPTRSIQKLAQVLNTSTGYLLGETDDPKRYTSRLLELVGTDGNEPSLMVSKHDAPGGSGEVARLIYEQDGKRLDLPDTPENRELFEKLVVAMMTDSLKKEFSDSPHSGGAVQSA